MSYTKPTMYQQADPLAFSKGFDAAFQKQQDAFKADLEERKRIADEADKALANAYGMADLGPINNMDVNLQNSIQEGLNSIVENGDFANASKADQAKMLQKLGLVKNTAQKIGDIIGVDTEDWDLRNDPKLSAFRAAVLRGDKDVSFEANGLDFKIKGSFGEITFDDIANARIINKAPYEEELTSIDNNFKSEYLKSLFKAYESGKSDQEIQEVKNAYKNIYSQRIKNSDPDFKKYLQYNVAETADEDEMAENMFYRIDSQVMSDPDLILKRKPEQKPKEKQLGLDDQQREVALSNIVSLTDSKRDPETGVITKDSPYFDIRMKGPNDVVPAKYRFRKLDGKYYVIKPGMGTPEQISKEEVYELFGYGEQYKEQQQKIVESNITKAKEDVAERYGIQPVVFDGSN